MTQARSLYIFDLDGTLANIEHRLPLLQSKERDRWRRFYEACDRDEPNLPIVETLNRLSASGAEIWLFSGRSDDVREKTIFWLALYTVLKIEEIDQVLSMRPSGDYREDVDLKREWLQGMLDVDRERLVAIFEDRSRLVAMWRELGITCFQVTDGNY